MQFKITVEASKPESNDHNGKTIALFATENLDTTTRPWQRIFATQIQLAIARYELSIASTPPSLMRHR